MNHTLTIARREISEKRAVFYGAAALAVSIMIVPLVRPHTSSDWRTVFAVGSGILSIGFGFAMSIILGATVIGRDLNDRRLSFYFTKPVNAGAIWFGKLIASAILIVCGTLIVMIPAAISGSVAWGSTVNSDKFIVLLSIIFTWGFMFGHILSTIVRSRSPIGALDLAAMTVLAVAAWWIVQPLLSHFALGMLLFIAKVFGWCALVAAVAAGLWQLERGRTDRVHSHAAMSQFLWPAIGVAMAICGAIVWWVVSATPADLIGDYFVRNAARGDVAVVAGIAKHRRDFHPIFVINTHDGRFERLPTEPIIRILFAGDGSKFMFVEPIDASGTVGEVHMRDAAVKGNDYATGLMLRASTSPIALSADANRIAYVTQNVLSVYDIPTRRSLGSVHVEDASAAWFVNSNLVRLTTESGPMSKTHKLTVYEYNLENKNFAQTGRYESTDWNIFYSANADASRIFVRHGRDVTVIDGRSCAPLLEMPNVGTINPLPDGRLIASDERGIHLYGMDGKFQRTFPVKVNEGVTRYWGVRMIAPDKIIVATKPGAAWQVVLIDVNTGAVLRRQEGFKPVFGDWFSDPRRQMASPNQIFADRAGHLVRWNPLTNDTTILTGKRS